MEVSIMLFEKPIGISHPYQHTIQLHFLKMARFLGLLLYLAKFGNIQNMKIENL